MNDMSGLHSAVGIEAVESAAEPSGAVTVRVTGHWHRSHEGWDPAELVIDAEGERHRLAAVPEAAPLGMVPGTWRMAFTVGPDLASRLGGHTWLAVGPVMVPLSLPPADEIRVQRVAADPELLAERELRGYEAAAQTARRQAASAEARALALREEIDRLQSQLEDARREPQRLQALIAERERELLLARQATHAETARREEIQRRLDDQERATQRLRAHARVLAARVDELERELRRARRGVDEARHEAAAARAAAGRAERQARALPVGALRRPGLPDPARLEQALCLAALAPGWIASSVPAAGMRDPAGGWALAAAESALARERGLGIGRDGVVERARLAAELAVVREQLWREREALGREREALGRERVVLERERAHGGGAIAGPGSVGGGGAARALAASPVELDRLAQAFARLRETHAPLDDPDGGVMAPARDADAGGNSSRHAPAGSAPGAEELDAALVRAAAASAAAPAPGADPAAAGRSLAIPTGAPPDLVPTLFRSLAREDPGAAGRLVLALLPAQHLAYPRPVAYDLVLGPVTCVHVTVGAGAPEIKIGDGPRDPAVVQFRVEGDAATLARLLAAGPLRRLLRRGLARRRGDRHAFAALRQLVGTPLWAAQLHRCGVQLDASLVLRMAALAVHRAGAPGLAFSLAHRVAGAPGPDATLSVGADGTASVSELALAAAGAPAALEPAADGGAVRASTEIVCPPSALLGVLLGEGRGEVQTSGDRRPLEIVRAALARA